MLNTNTGAAHMTNATTTPAASEVDVECGYCRSRAVTLRGDDAAEYIEASDERKPSVIGPTCAETCRAHAKQMRAHAEWLAEGAVR